LGADIVVIVVALIIETLAIEGGSKAVTNQLTGWPQFEEEAVSAVTEVLRSGKVNYWTGKKGMEFERSAVVPWG
jgi:hypothetical protein